MSDESEGKLDAAVGEALMNWHTVESALCCIFEFYVTKRTSADSPTVAAEAFWSLEGFGPRLRMTDAVVRYAESDPDARREWERLAERTRRTSTQRNALAHGSKAVVFSSDRKESRFVLLRRQSASIPERSNVLGAHEINRMGENFGELGVDLMIYWHRRQGLPEFERSMQEARDHRRKNPHLKLKGGRSIQILVESAEGSQGDPR